MGRFVSLISLFAVICSTGTFTAQCEAQTSPPDGSPPKAIKACAILSKDEIKKVAGPKTPLFFDQIAVTEETLAGGGSECFFPGIIVQLDAVAVSQFEANRKAYEDRTKYERITGVGDEAYFYEQGTPGTPPDVVGVYSKVGKHVVVFSMDIGPSESTTSLRPTVIAIAQAGTAKLRQ